MECQQKNQFGIYPTFSAPFGSNSPGSRSLNKASTPDPENGL